MKNTLFRLLVLMLFISCSDNVIEQGTVNIIPKPLSQVKGEGYFTLSKNSKIITEEVTQEKIAKLIFNGFMDKCGWVPKITSKGNTGDIVLTKNIQLSPEAYILDVSPDKINLQASSDPGFFYGLQSLLQLMPTSFYSNDRSNINAWQIPAVHIEDEPAFEWRGFMLDVSRHFFSVDQVKEVLDFMASLKLNRFHWHLADDQGWRVEIEAYPKLTEIGAWRMDYNNQDETMSDWWGRPVQKEGEKPSYGGFYTKQQIREIVAYAKDRQIEVIPEIDMPGHAQATIAAYPEIGCVNAAPYVATGGVFKNNTYNPGKEETFEFAEKMLNEIMELFPFKYIHIGGDECNKSQWKIDPHAQSKMKALGLKNENELQSHFNKRIEKIINARDRIMIGWDEILEGGLAPNAVVMSWRGEAGGITSVKAGHEVIMTPNKYCYIDLKQGHDDLEPNLGYSQLLLSTAYNYQVIPDTLTTSESKLIKGIQANLWTESISDWGKLTYMTFPRVYAIAENAWTTQENKNWDDFTDRLLTQMERLEKQETRYAKSAFSPWIDHNAVDGAIEISLKTEVNELDIYYTLDGTEPNLQSEKYEAPFSINESSTIKACAFKNEEAVGSISEMHFPIHLAGGLKVIDENKKPLTKLTDLNYGRLNVGDSNWEKVNGDFSATVIFDQSTEVHEVNFSSLRFTISGVYPPNKIEVLASEDGEDFSLLKELDQSEKSRIQGRNKVRHQIEFTPTSVKALKIKAYSHRPIEEGHHRAGQNSVIAIDETQVN